MPEDSNNWPLTGFQEGHSCPPNDSPDAENLCDDLVYTSQHSFTMSPDVHPDPNMTLAGPNWQLQRYIMDMHPSQYMDTPGEPQGSYCPIPASLSSTYPAGDHHRYSQNTMTTTYPHRPAHHPRVNNAGSIYGTTLPPVPVTGPVDSHQHGFEGDEKFRYRVLLRAPTAMVTNPTEAPVTYLNKSQGYQLTIIDTKAPVPPSEQAHVRYRTHIRISFHRDDQRSNPNAHWQLWKAGRALSANGQGDKEQGPGSATLCAIEYLDNLMGGTVVNEAMSSQEVQLEKYSFDGFCILWSCKHSEPTQSPSALPPPECNITVRFNFLTTDFCQYKGVKGFPVRLCARTEMVEDYGGTSLLKSTREEDASEVCYHKVNLFRMYGAERKLAADAARVRKALEKVWREIHKRQPAPDPHHNGSDKNASSISAAANRFYTRRYKNQVRILEELQERAELLQVRLSSARPVTVLSLRGDTNDIPGPPVGDHSAQVEFAKDADGDHQSAVGLRYFQDESSSSSPWEASLLLESEELSPGNNQDKSSLCQVVRVPKNSAEDATSAYIEVLDIDPSYEPVTHQQIKPVVCFYIGFVGIDQKQVDYYNALYLTERTAHNLIEQISKKISIDPRRVKRLLLVRENSIELVDDNIVGGIADEQVILAEVSETWSFNCMSENHFEIKLRY
ncbi:CP2 transcription factor-domain-containing protein [Aspergillus pseudoustus]|uniref:CP2 transcription factor-domain-containing protein n=1 Tax=Aspergillus pseudoustus TaxID=1810923 RepID=A0ABR4KIA0_9EURO